VSGGIVSAASSFLAIGSMVSSGNKTRDVILYLSANAGNDKRTIMETITMKGAVVAVLTLGSTVQIWVASPTGDSSDSHIFEMPTTSESHAHVVANMWRKAWNLPVADSPVEF
jgi:hypothetical protein